MTTETQVFARWRKSSRSGSPGDNCVEVAETTGVIGVRDSKDVDDVVLVVSSSAWHSFIRTVTTGELGAR